MAGYYDDVYAIVCRIPPGRVSTYGRIAAMTAVPRGARGVGMGVARAWSGAGAPRPLVACDQRGRTDQQRVLRRPARALLEAEGVVFNEHGYVDLHRYLWDGKPS
jgi:methylated-DNA-protein-cysteine methyltransferase-like protein